MCAIKLNLVKPVEWFKNLELLNTSVGFYWQNESLCSTWYETYNLKGTIWTQIHILSVKKTLFYLPKYHNKPLKACSTMLKAQYPYFFSPSISTDI